MKFFIISLLFGCIVASPLQAAPINIHPSGGIQGSAGAGFVIFKTLAPNNLQFNFTNNVYAALSVEKALGFLSMYIVFSLDYLTSNGYSLYSYTTPAGLYSSGSNLAYFNSNFFEAGLGIRLKLIENYFIRPYVEGGGLGGYFTIKYNNLTTALTVKPDNNYKSEDSLLEFGSYYEGGIEVAFSQRFGVRAAARFTTNTTKPLITLANKELKYSSEIYYLSLLTTF